ncbi:hypothetical protein DL93DRAFT_2071583, partial [Clavulina sp. PMI_390]
FLPMSYNPYHTNGHPLPYMPAMVHPYPSYPAFLPPTRVEHPQERIRALDQQSRENYQIQRNATKKASQLAAQLREARDDFNYVQQQGWSPSMTATPVGFGVDYGAAHYAGAPFPAFPPQHAAAPTYPHLYAYPPAPERGSPPTIRTPPGFGTSIQVPSETRDPEERVFDKWAEAARGRIRVFDNIHQGSQYLNNLEVHPSLSHRSYELPFVDLRLEEDYVRLSGADPASSWFLEHEDLANQPATLPPLTRLRLRSDYVPGEILVSNARGVTVGDVLKALLHHFQAMDPEIQPPPPAKRPSPAQMHAMDTWAFNRDFMSNSGYYKPIRFVDRLGNSPIFDGLIHDQRWTREVFGEMDRDVLQMRFRERYPQDGEEV